MTTLKNRRSKFTLQNKLVLLQPIQRPTNQRIGVPLSIPSYTESHNPYSSKSFGKSQMLLIMSPIKSYILDLSITFVTDLIIFCYQRCHTTAYPIIAILLYKHIFQAYQSVINLKKIRLNIHIFVQNINESHEFIHNINQHEDRGHFAHAY